VIYVDCKWAGSGYGGALEVDVLDWGGKPIINCYVDYREYSDAWEATQNMIALAWRVYIYQKRIRQALERVVSRTPMEIASLLGAAGVDQETKWVEWSVNYCGRDRLGFSLSLVGNDDVLPPRSQCPHPLLAWQRGLPGLPSRGLASVYTLVTKDISTAT